MGEFKGNPFKYKESELKDRHVGKYIEANGPYETREKYKIKKTTYTNEGVWGAYTALRTSFRSLFIDLSAAEPFVDSALSNEAAQMMIDTFLFRRCRGEEVEVPKEVVPVNAAPGEKMVELLNADDFGTLKAVSANTEIRWIFNNMKMANVDKKTAPSPGAYALLKEMQDNAEMRRDFWKTLYPKLMTKEEGEKGGKLNDDGKETVKLIERLLEAAESE